MKRLYDEYFHVPENGKISDKVMLVRVITTVVIMIACLAAMSFTAYAYFSSNVTSVSNIIKSANFDISVSFGENEIPVDVKKEDANTYSTVLEPGQTYTVTIGVESSSTAKTGFCVIKADKCVDVYHTQQLWKDDTDKDSITFDIAVTEKTTVQFIPHWGTSSYYDEYRENGEGNKLYITDENIGDKAVIIKITNQNDGSDDEKE